MTDLVIKAVNALGAKQGFKNKKPTGKANEIKLRPADWRTGVDCLEDVTNAHDNIGDDEDNDMPPLLPDSEEDDGPPGLEPQSDDEGDDDDDEDECCRLLLKHKPDLCHCSNNGSR